MRTLLGVLLGVLLCSSARVGEAESARLVLALGDDSYLRAEAVAGVEVTNELGDRDLLQFAAVILSNTPYGQLPGAVRERLREFLEQGGSLLITGGPNAYGSGGYQPMAALIPFQIRTDNDWRAVPFREIIPLQPGHPILDGVTFGTIGSFNDLNPKPGTVEIAQYAGAGVGFPSPLIAEEAVGRGTVVGVAFDLGREIRGGWAAGSRFGGNLLSYLVSRSAVQASSSDHRPPFSEWQETCQVDPGRCKRPEMAARVHTGERSEETRSLEVRAVPPGIERWIENRQQ
jgi:hypothetical protein